MVPPVSHETVLARVEAALQQANQNLGRNTYLWRNEEWTRAEALRSLNHAGPLAGLAVSVKDCFDLAGAPTTLGIHGEHSVAPADSWLVEQLRAAGAVIVGKTHMHPLAYGLTGENPYFGDCLQPGDAGALTGGSSSGAAASVMEGSAEAAIGSDTGGSIRIPAALCGVAGYRASIGLGDWRGGGHLAESFDTMGWLFRDLADGPRLGSIFGVTATPEFPSRYAVVHDEFLSDCEPVIVENLRRCEIELHALGLTGHTVEVSWWSNSREIFTPIQAAEASRHHRGDQPGLDPSIRQRLEWGASLTEAEVSGWRVRHHEFRDRMDALLEEHQLLLLPAAPVTRLAAGVDHAPTRPRLLRYSTPGSLSGMPVVTIPYLHDGRPAGGMQLMAARGDDVRLLAVAAALGRHQQHRRPS
jgi:Asp-tRNA(Asn)/Glu-tRNA(Gln) amidotransferase A subunit family amidase